MWCSTTKGMLEGEELVMSVVDASSGFSSIQLLPQQATLASILPNAIINKDIFPCKTCGIWFRSERNLQAHLMYYCSGRQKESDLVMEKVNSKNHQLSHSSTYPEVNHSAQGTQALEMPPSTHSGFKTEETAPGNSLKCTICDYTAETLVAFQPHILSHLSQSGLRCSHCHFTFQMPGDLQKHQELHRHGGVSVKSAKENETGHSRSLGTVSPKHDRSDLGVLESPSHESIEQEGSALGQKTIKNEVNLGNKTSFSYTRVKSEPSSPRLASSPIQNHVSPAFPVPPFMTHVPLSQDVTAVPQASEILAKMSELVHRRLRHGANSFPPVMYGALVPKGATCFECNINFGNLDNYLVHKKHYCYGRWQHMAKSHALRGLDKSADPFGCVGLAGMLNSCQPFEVKDQDTTQFKTSLKEPARPTEKAPGESTAQVTKTVTLTGAEEENTDLKTSQKTSLSEININQTTCDACKITFSRQETFMVHKQYYCATRHDPPMKRPANKLGHQKPLRARKRRKMPSPDLMVPISGYLPTISGPYISRDALEHLKDQYHHQSNLVQGLLPKHPESSLTITKSALGSKCNATAQEEGDAPIDLSKKCELQFGKISSLMDYHECALCKISFNRVEDYLSHKQNFCPLTNKEPSMTKEGFENSPENPNSSHVVQSGSSATVDILEPVEKQTSVADKDRMQNLKHHPKKKMRTDNQIWPYYDTKPADYATGIFVSQSERRQSPYEGVEGEKEQPMPDGSHVSGKNVENCNAQVEVEPGSKSCANSDSSIHLTTCTPDPEDTTKERDSSSPKAEENLKKSINGSIYTTANVKYCRPCDIQFNSLSNFITHKKFYCSAQTTEHVK